MTLPLEPTIGVVAALAGAIGVLWRQLLVERATSAKLIAEWQDRWIREVRRGPHLAMAPPPESATVPPPDWEEDTGVRDMRAELVDEELRRYVETTPPRPLRRR